MSVVYVVQESRYRQHDGTSVSHDYTTLYKYGPVSFLLPSSRKMLEEAEANELDLLKEKLANFNPETDYIVFSGDPVLCGLAAIVIYSVTTEDCKTITVLKWSREEMAYAPVTIPLP